ncbi:MAG: molybdopterin-dependent oxidoreductase [Candidatus Bathyarchaeia archaeon]
MQVLKQHKIIILVAVFLVVILLVSFFIVENGSKPSPTPSSTPLPTPSPTYSPSPTETSPTPTETSSPIPTTSPSQTPTSTPSTGPFYYPGEVTQYQGENLDSVNTFLQLLITHPDVSINGVQNINQATYRLTVTDLVNKSLSYTYNDVVNNFTLYQQVDTLLCVEGWRVTCLWQGVLLSDLLKEAGISPNATTLIFSASDGYTTELPINYVMQNNIFLAYKMNNITLPAAAGWPFMLIVPNQYGYKWIRWVTQIDVSNDTSYLGYWESRGYPNDATIS